MSIKNFNYLLKYYIILYIYSNFIVLIIFNKKKKINLNIKLLILFILNCLNFLGYSFNNYKNIKIALCAVGKKENLYIKEFINYYIKLGIDHFFIYDDNNPKTEKFSSILDYSYKPFVTIIENNKENIKFQSNAYNHCYKNNSSKFEWFLFVDIDEFLFIKKFNLKQYLTKTVFNKCDFIKFHWVLPTDNNLLFYDNRSLFERFKPPYIKSKFTKSIIRGNIQELKYMVHSPYKSPIKNISCNNIGKEINYKYLNIEYIDKINIKQAYIIHFRYKSTEEFINKYKRGYTYWSKDRLLNFLSNNIDEYFRDNKITLEKINYFEKELKINLYKYKYYLNKN